MTTKVARVIWPNRFVNDKAAFIGGHVVHIVEKRTKELSLCGQIVNPDLDGMFDEAADLAICPTCYMFAIERGFMKPTGA